MGSKETVSRGFEPLTLASVGRCSIQLSYETKTATASGELAFSSNLSTRDVNYFSQEIRRLDAGG